MKSGFKESILDKDDKIEYFAYLDPVMVHLDFGLEYSNCVPIHLCLLFGRDK